jgi:hypothetical protein
VVGQTRIVALVPTETQIISRNVTCNGCSNRFYLSKTVFAYHKEDSYRDLYNNDDNGTRTLLQLTLFIYLKNTTLFVWERFKCVALVVQKWLCVLSIRLCKRVCQTGWLVQPFM